MAGEWRVCEGHGRSRWKASGEYMRGGGCVRGVTGVGGGVWDGAIHDKVVDECAQCSDRRVWPHFNMRNKNVVHVLLPV